MKKYYGDALHESAIGDTDLAVAAWRGLLMEPPIRINVEKTRLGRRYAAAIQKGLNMWTNSLGYSPFVVTEKPGSLKVRFPEDISSSDDLQGQVDAEYEASEDESGVRWKLRGEIDIAWKVDGRQLSAGEVTNVMGHELGHVLGLADIEEEGGIMDRFIPGHPHLAPSQKEVQAVIDFHEAIRAQIKRAREHLIARASLASR